jgi:photosystem II stability/assembly factor-like uncharacterized protein
MVPPARSRTVLAVAAWLLAWAGGGLPAAPRPVPAGPSSGAIDPAVLAGLKWRSVGPAPHTQPRWGDAVRGRGGRSIAISGVRGRPNEGYFGAAGGGLWKTTDRGLTWVPVTDGQVRSSSVGAVAVSETNPDIVFIGFGESCIRGDAMSGDGVYKSVDASRTWTHLGFEDAPVISKIRIHPTNPDIVFVAAFGRMSAPSERRGIFKSIDGGRTWRRTLFRDTRTGAVDLSIDPHHPEVMFAALWEAYRLEYTMASGGSGSGLFKSVDGGETWTEITRNPGLPAGIIGKIGVAVSGADPARVYAIIENERGGLFRSDDAGATWTLVNGGRNIRQRAFYYTHLAADPANRDVVYVLNVGAFKSVDGGATLTAFAFGDSHDLWIDPDDPRHLLHAMDGGGAITYTGGVASGGAAAWSERDFPTAQYYHVVTTKHVPYHVCGAHQDGSTVCVSSAAGRSGARGRGPGSVVPPYGVGGSEPGFIAPDPKDLDVFFSGGNNGSFIERVNRRTGESREVGPYPVVFSGEPASALVERFQWTFPIVFSPVDPRVLLTASQHVWKSTDGGDHWARISGDLTRHDPKTMGASGGPITHDMNSPEVYGTVFAVAPGKTDAGVIWAGSDDGLIHVTRDGGRTWADVTPTGMPEFGRVSIIDASAFDTRSAYAAVKRPLLDDFAPYVFRTHDFGRTWARIVSGIAPDDYVHVVREDPTRRGLLYAGTQHGVYVSFDDGGAWQSLSLNLPDTPVSDLVVEDHDLVISTHGRGFYILDDIGPLRQADALAGRAGPCLFRPSDAIRSAGDAVIQYLLRTRAGTMTIDLLDARGTVAASLAGGQDAATTPGLHAVRWNLRYPDATSFPGMILWGGEVTGPMAPPGTYQVRLTVDGVSQTQPLRVRRHPFHEATDADLAAQFAFLIRVRDTLSEANGAVVLIRSVVSQVTDRLARSRDARLQAAGDRLSANLRAVEGEIYQVRNQSGQDPLNFPIKVNNRLASLLSMVGNGDGPPTTEAPAILARLTAELKVHTDALARVLAVDLAAFNAEASRLGLSPVAPTGHPVTQRIS